MLSTYKNATYTVATGPRRLPPPDICQLPPIFSIRAKASGCQNKVSFFTYVSDFRIQHQKTRPDVLGAKTAKNFRRFAPIQSI
uniref:Uncharacterized protein n=1 Tax=Romanomermis culicivorax TaxID=13658 RepID=A0A915IX67_ROMCU